MRITHPDCGTIAWLNDDEAEDLAARGLIYICRLCAEDGTIAHPETGRSVAEVMEAIEPARPVTVAAT
jgi:hypothetical protein